MLQKVCKALNSMKGKEKMRKKLLAIVAALAMVLTMIPATAFAAGTTADTSWYDAAESEFTLTDSADLLGLAELVNGGNDFAEKTVKLGADIDLAGIAWTPIGVNGKAFSGTLDGQDKTIKNLAITSDAKTIGLFGYVQSTAKNTSAAIKNLKLDTVTIKANGNSEYTYTGALVGEADRTIVEKVSAQNVTVTVNANSMNTTTVGAGLIGFAYCVKANDCDVNTVNVNYSGDGSAYLGGLVGYVVGHSTYWTAEGCTDNSKFSGCSVNDVKIDSEQSADKGKAACVGGFTAGCAAYNGSHNTYENCDVTGLDMNCSGNGKYMAGGFMAVNRGMGSDSNCTANGIINSTGTNENSVFGGFMGQQGGRGRTHSNHEVDVDINAVDGFAGGFVGKTVQYLLAADHANHYEFNNCIANGDVKCTNGTAGGFAGESGCYGGDGHQIWVDYNNCEANGDVTGDIAGGFLGAVANKSADFTNPERSGVTLTDCTVSGAVTGTSKAAGVIGNVDNCKNDIVTPVEISGSFTSGSVSGGETNPIFNKTENSKDITAIVLNQDKMELVKGATGQLTADTIPENSDVVWSSSDESVATVDENGKVTAVAVGEATITATNGDVSATCECTVVEEQKVPVNPGEADTPAKGDTAAKTDKADATAATGDDMNMVLPIAVAGLALAAMAAVVATRRKHD